MKRKLRIVSIFILIITLMCNLFLYNNKSVKASGSLANITTITTNLLVDSNGSVTISASGVLTITYKYGFTEFLIVATRCSQYMKEVSNPLGSGEAISKAKSCAADGFFGKSEVIHVSGDYNDTASGSKTKTINIGGYLSASEIYKVELVSGSFINEAMQFDTDTGEPLNTGKYEPLFCYVNSHNNCQTNAGESVNAITASYRVQNFVNYKFGSFTYRKVNGVFVYTHNRPTSGADYQIRLSNSNGIIYKGDSTSSRSDIILTDEEAAALTVTNYQGSAVVSETTRTAYEKYHVAGTTNSPVLRNSTTPSTNSEQKTETDNLIYDTIIPTLITILLVLAGVTIAVEGYKIVKSADEPQERQERIKHLRSILIGIGIAMLLLFVIEPLSNVVVEFLE